MTRYILYPVTEGESRSLKIPPGLITNDLYDEVKDKISDTRKLNWLLESLAKNDVSASVNGNVTYKGAEIEGGNLRDAIIDSCNNVFLEKYESFYKILRSCNIVF